MINVPASVLVASLIVLPGFVTAQDVRDDVRDVAVASRARGPFPDSPVLGVPFSAEATLIVTQTKSGVASQRTAVTQFYRDSKGRSRVDYQAPFNDRPGSRTVAVIWSEPAMKLVYMVDPATRTTRPLPRDVLNNTFNAWATFNLPVGLSDFYGAAFDFAVGQPGEPLGQRTIEGLKATGWRFGGDESANNRDERWESPELKMVLRAHFIDSRMGAEIDYRLTNIKMNDPDASLFDVPPDYAVVTTGPVPGQPGDPLFRSGGPGR